MNIHWVISAALATALTACQNSEIELQLIENMDSETVISDTNLIKLDIIDQSNEFRHDQDLPPMATELGFWFCEKYE